MNGTPALRQRLDARIRLTLEPARFPERRDVELVFDISGNGPGVTFLDHFWVGSTGLWAVTARIDRQGLEGGVAATVTRQILRALAAELGEPSQVLSTLRAEWGENISDLAVVRLDTATGAFAGANFGGGLCTTPQAMEPGGIVWIGLGGSLPDEMHPEPDGLEALVASKAGGAREVLAAIHFKGPSKNGKSTTLVVRNDRSAIVDALAAARAFLERHAAPEEDCTAVELMLDEILTNQVNYGYRDGSVHEILVEIRLEGDRLAVEIRDDGIPFDPLQIASPDLNADIDERQIGGLGMHFVRSLVDEISYRRSGGWNVLALSRGLGKSDTGGQIS